MAMGLMSRRACFLPALLGLALPGLDAAAGSDPDAELENELKFLAAERQTVVTASKIVERVEKTIATTTVVTQEDIRRMGARNLLDVLRTVPGIGVTQSALGLREIEVRGIKSQFSEKVLLLLNGHPLDQNLHVGGATYTYDDLPVDTLKRIEIVRGPGSALYGANAFLAVINLITLQAKDLDGVQSSAGWGSFGTQQYRLSAGKGFENGAEAAVHFNFTDTDGIGAPITADSLSVQGKSSLAPGPSQLTEQRNDLEWQLGYGGFKLDGRFINKRMGAFVGVQYALSDRTLRNYDNYFLRLSRAWTVGDALTITGQAYYDQLDLNNLLQPTPSQFSQAALTDSRTGGEVQATYRVSARNTAIGGLSYARESQYDVFQSQVGSDPGLLVPGLPFSKEPNRDHWGIYGQDVWDPFDSLRLTLGARYDQYSHFGGTFNPRLGFNWEFVQNYSLKFSYGTAFRAPAFGELSLINNPVWRGNPDLKPEQIETFETGLVAHPLPGLSTQAVYYHSHIGQIIGLVPIGGSISQYENNGSILSEGVEWEARYDSNENFFPGSYLLANYVYQNPLSQNRSLADVPHNRANLMLNWAFTGHWSGFAQVLVKSQTGRSLLETYKLQDVPGYAMTNMGLATHNLPWKGVDVGFTVYNLLDKTYYDPSPVQMPIDFPAAGRAYFGHISLKF